MGARARQLAKLPVAAPASTQESSKATSARARFLGPSIKPPWAGSRKTAVIPDSSKALSRFDFSSVHSCVLRAPSATRRATGPRATPREDCTIICKSYRSAKRHMIWRASSPGNVRKVSLSKFSSPAGILSW